MPQLIAFALIGALGWYGYRAFKKEMAKISEKVRKEEKTAQPETDGELQRDPKTGVYRLKKKD
jgi:hypothetical protein